ncbi:RWD domain-containing protein 1-like [Paramacrobiotus metropolitanus]|uniref:RWD domain-containing protein 1-like n=1 Tax=Paramacrobiotus metropolitanus TaxID=2943436 RepID=UPI002445EE85|nr:RWD domain-containing protein 1-like [Paramacrobiotus metropolitanus]
MDRREEQQIEIDSLLSIYPDELTVLTSENSDPEIPEIAVDPGDERIQFTLKISSSEAAVGNSAGSVITTLWKFVFPDEYPDVAPEIRLIDPGEMPPDSKDELSKVADAAAQESIGMASVFTVVSAVQDYLNKHAEDCLNRFKEMSLRAKREEEEEERRKIEGTRVNVESFIVWKAKFDAERTKKTKTPETTAVKRLTGRQMFEQNTNLDSSDQQLMEEGEECADIDEREETGQGDDDFDRELFEQELLNEENDN